MIFPGKQRKTIEFYGIFEYDEKSYILRISVKIQGKLPRKTKRGQEKMGRRKRRSEKKKIGVIAAAVVIVIAVAVIGYVHTHNKKVTELLQAEGIYHGITIDGEDVSGMSETEAFLHLREKYEAGEEGKVLTLYHGEDEWEIPFAEIGAGYDVAGAVKEAYQTGREGTEEERRGVASQLLKEGMDIVVAYTYDEALLTEKLTAVAEEFDREAENSTVSRSGGKFNITKEKEGRVMEKEKTAEAVAAVIETKKSGRAEIAAELTEPKITAEDNAYITDLIGTYYTTYNYSDPNRNNNLAVGCEYINGTILASGEIFSANAELGSQTAAGGYKMAGVYSNGKVEQGMAGGVCQVTSTLYNAAIMAELEIVERHPHSMTVGYVPLGRDAAVAGTYKDLKFKNSTEYPILIEAYAANGKLVMNIYGHEEHSAGRKVEYETVYEATIPKPAEIVKEDPEKPEGEREITSKGRTGSKVSIYKKVYQNGSQISREWFSSSSYRAVADEVTVGTKKAETKTEIPTTPSWAENSTGNFGIQ